MGLSIIGIAGAARVGKDTVCSELIDYLEKKGVTARRLAFADALKNDINHFLLDKAGVNAYSNEEDHKLLIRPLLVAYGKLMRDLSGGLYWINELNKGIKKNLEQGVVSIVSDVRYPNEARWINSIKNGITIHLTRNGINCANEEESINDPLTQKESTYCLNWPDTHAENISSQALNLIHEIKLHHSVRPSVNQFTTK